MDYDNLDFENRRMELDFMDLLLPAKRMKRGEFWDTLCSLINNGTKSWACMGDFNKVLEQSKKSGGREVTMKNSFFLRKYLDDMHGLDISLCGNTFTWCNKRSGLANVRERLDRVIASTEWRTTFGNARVIHLNALHSDHAPIILNRFLDQPNLLRPFRFQKIWIKDPSCCNVVRGAWDCNTSHAGRVSIGRRIINTTRSLRRWNRETFRLCNDQILEIEQMIKWIQSLPSTEENLNKERILQEDLSEWLNRQEVLWRQNSRELWFTVGDRNSKFFHTATVTNYRKIFIATFKNNYEEWLETNGQIGDFLSEEFTKLCKLESTIQ